MMNVRRIAKSFIPEPEMIDNLRYENGTTMDIIETIIYADKAGNYAAAKSMQSVAENLWHPDISKRLYNVWSFVKTNIKYVADKIGHEKIKSPARLYADGFGDCKSFSLMIGSILRNYQDIGYSYRFVMYPGHTDYSHVYVTADTPHGEFILDSVHSKFNDELRYKKKIDHQMTKISHITGLPSIRANIKPTMDELFADGPKVAISPSIDIKNKSQGEIKLLLADAQLQIKEAYYGDYTGLIAASREQLRKASQSLENYTVDGSIHENLIPIIRLIKSSQERHIQQIETLIQFAPEYMGIRGQWKDWRNFLNEADLSKCLANHPHSKANWTERNFGKSTWIDFNGESYEIDDKDYPEFTDCIQAARQKRWAADNVFENPDFKKGSLAMLYEFYKDAAASGTLVSTLNSDGSAKKVIQSSFVDAFSTLSGLDRDNVRLYTRNGIMYASALTKLPGIDPVYALSALSHSINHRGTPGIGVEPVTTAAIIGLITAIAGAASSISQLFVKKPEVGTSLQNMAKGLLGEGTKADVDDWEAKSAEYLQYIIPAAAVAAGAYILTQKSK